MTEQENSLITVIVPVYKVEKYLNRCVDSILAQTYTNFECILVDDGSPDNCGKICDEYAQKDRRVRVIHQKNAGVSAARNAGLDIAKGEWIGFVDSDDWIEPNMYEVLYKDVIEQNCDCAICDFIGKPKRKNPKIITETVEALISIFAKNGYGGYSFLRLINAKKIGSIRFDEKISYMEDSKFFYGVFENCKTIYWDNAQLYHYEQNEDSVTHKYGLSDEAKSAILMLDKIFETENRLKVKKSINESRLQIIYNFAFFYIKNNDLKNTDYKSLKNKLKQNFFIILKSKNFSIKMKIVVMFMFLNLEVFLRNLFLIKKNK